MTEKQVPGLLPASQTLHNAWAVKPRDSMTATVNGSIVCLSAAACGV